ncbi:MAG TPA: hypothetical protein VIB49_03700 [Thermoplasmata archaeon]|jgi:hypothetical protein
MDAAHDSGAKTEESAKGYAIRLGFWSAILTAVFAAATIGIGIFGTSYTAVPQSYPYSIPFNPVDYAWLYPATLLAPTFVALLACIHACARGDKRVFSLVALSFGLIYAVVIAIVYFIQWTVVLPSIRLGETEGLSLFIQSNPHGLFVALESLAYLMMTAAFLAAAPVFAGGRLERAIRWLFVGGFVAAIVAFAALSWMGAQIVVFEVAVIAIVCIVLIAGGAMLSVLFRRARSGRQEGSARG